MTIASNPDPDARGRWAARCAAARKDLDNDHAAAAARARRTMIGGGDVWIRCVVRRRRIDRRHWGGHQFPGARDIGFAGGARQQPIVANAMEALRQNVEQEAPLGSRPKVGTTA